MTTKAQATFSVTAMMREERSIVERFIDYYRAAGAEQIYLYHDGPTEHLEGLDLTGVVLTECTGAFWQRLCGEKPKTLSECLWQTHACSARRHTSDWLFVVDADEYLTGGSVTELLTHVPDSVEALRVRNVEAVWGPGDDILQPFGNSYFRKPLRGVQARVLLRSRLLYGRVSPFFGSGLIGHNVGKHFLRRGTKFTEIRSHFSLDGNRRLGQWAHEVVPGAKGYAVLHFDAISFERWREKWRRRYSGELPSNTMRTERQRQQGRIQKAIEGGREASLTMFQKFYGLSQRQYTLLRFLGQVERHWIFPEASTNAQAGKRGSDHDRVTPRRGKSSQ